MFLKELIEKSTFDKNGYVLLETSLSNNSYFNNLINEIEDCVSKKVKDSSIKNLGGYIMGNFGINQGPFGSKFYSLVFQDEFISYFENLTLKL